MLGRLLRESLIYGLSNLLARGLSLLLIPLYTRFLAPADFGALDMLGVVAGVVNLVAVLEISQGVARFFPDAKSAEDRRAYASSGLWFTLAAYTACAMLLAAFAAPVADLLLDSGEHAGVIRVGAAALWANGLFYFLQNQLRWQLQPADYARASLASSLALAATAVVLVGFAHMGLPGVLWAQVAGGLAGSAFAWRYACSSLGFAFDRAKLCEMLRFSLPLAVSSSAALVTLYADRIAIKELVSLSELGLYGVAQRFAAAVGLLLVGFQGAITPLVTKYAEAPETRAELGRLLRVFLALALPTILALAVFSRELLVVFATPAFYPAHGLVPLLALASLLGGMYVFAPGLWLARRTRATMGINLAVGAVNVALNLLLVPRLGATGAAFAATGSAATALVLYARLGHGHFPVPVEAVRLGGAALLLGAGMAGAWACPVQAFEQIPVRLALCLAGSAALAGLLLGRGGLSAVAAGIARVPRR